MTLASCKHLFPSLLNKIPSAKPVYSLHYFLFKRYKINYIILQGAKNAKN